MITKPLNDRKVHACPICMHRDSIIQLCLVDNFQILTCENCNTDFVDNPPTSEELTAYYNRPEWFEGGEHGGYDNYDSQTEGSLITFRSLLEEYAGRTGLSVLDIGCGYGNHLALAARFGWKCFGVEPSTHARQVASSRLEGAAMIVSSLSELIPHEFDLILMFDVIEHVCSPYELFYDLFSMGAIVPKTRVIITTPNAGSKLACDNPVQWEYRHPPSHLVFYTANSLRFVLERLQFTNILVKGSHPIDGSKNDDDFLSFAGLEAQALGSNFTEFMRERYVPGTWSKVAQYEHIPRYKFACLFAQGKNVLDFGCGTGYGAAMLSEVAEKVIGLDIDINANKWACNTHYNSNLKFHLCDDLGEGLKSGSFDLITCFEMIEHVDQITQTATIKSISRLLQSDGILIISTPNPEVTQLYGENPYHLREMNELEFVEILAEHFLYIKVINQKVLLGISFEEQEAIISYKNIANDWHDSSNNGVKPLAFLAICSNACLPDICSFVTFEDTDYIREFTSKENVINASRSLVYQTSVKLSSELYNYRSQAAEFSRQVASLQNKLEKAQSHIEYQAIEKIELQSELQEYGEQAAEFSRQITALQNEMEKAQSHIAYQENELKKAQSHIAYQENELKKAQSQVAQQASELLRITSERLHELSSIYFLWNQLIGLVLARVTGKFEGKAR
ncbi:methyltransferase domain-containing protein [Methylomonas sp. MS20]|uniref:methyltransferase domain-containing protein n=1 Tax=Methylomonas sp. MS20 TaxID=3418769 RepID=UPI003CFD836B